MNIFQISQEILDIFQELEENGGELTEELEAQLDKIFAKEFEEEETLPEGVGWE